MKRVSPTFFCEMQCYKLETHARIKGVYKTSVSANKKH